MDNREERQKSAFEPQVQYAVTSVADAPANTLTIERILDSKNFEARRITLDAETALQGLPRDIAMVEREKRGIPAANRRVLDRVWQCRTALRLAATNPAFRRAVLAAREDLEFAREEEALGKVALADVDGELDAHHDRALDDQTVQVVAEGLAADFGLLNFDFVLQYVVRGDPPPLNRISWGEFPALGIDWPGFEQEERRFAHPWYWLNAVHEFERTQEHFLVKAASSLLKVVIAPAPPPQLTRMRAQWEAQTLTSIWICVGAANSEVDLRVAWSEVLKLKKRLPHVEFPSIGRHADGGLVAVVLADNPEQPAYFGFEVHRDTTLATARERFRRAMDRRSELRGGNLRRFRSPKDAESIAAAMSQTSQGFTEAARDSGYPDGDAFRKAFRRASDRWRMDEMAGAQQH